MDVDAGPDLRDRDWMEQHGVRVFGVEQEFQSIGVRERGRGFPDGWVEEYYWVGREGALGLCEEDGGTEVGGLGEGEDVCETALRGGALE